MPRKTSQGSAEEFFPNKITLPSLKEAAADCKACDLWNEARKLSSAKDAGVRQ